MKPALNKTVYCVYQESIFTTTVGYVGTDSFIISDFSDLYTFDALEWFYRDYEETWFTSLAKAKQHLISVLAEQGHKVKIIPKSEGYYECQNC